MPDLGSWAGADGIDQAGRRGNPHCPESDSGSWERTTVAFRSLDLPRTQAASPLSLSLLEGRILPKLGVAGERWVVWLSPTLDFIALFTHAEIMF